MKLSRFESLVLVVGAAAILGSLGIAFPAGGRPETVEILAHLLLLVILFAAVRFGRKGGLLAAIAAAVVYVLLRIPTLQAAPLSPSAALIIGSRLAAFGLLGVIGGEATTRVKYLFASLENGTAIDEWSHVFNERHAARELDQAIGRAQRYGEPFSLVLVNLSPSLFAGFTPARQRTIIRGLADQIRSDLRMVDEVARLRDGRFLVLLPHTPKSGGEVVGERLGALARTKLGAQDRSVTWQVLGAPEDTDTLQTLRAEMDDGEPSQEA